MIRVNDLETATAYYHEVFGLTPLWRDELSVGLGFPETDAEIVLHCNPELPNPVDVHYLVDAVESAVQFFREKDCQVLVEPFDIPIGKCAVIQDPFGTVLSILDMTKGSRPPLTRAGQEQAKLKNDPE
jgi:predicted enzyme related to lactoylglutathione lyase